MKARSNVEPYNNLWLETTFSMVTISTIRRTAGQIYTLSGPKFEWRFGPDFAIFYEKSN